MAPRPLRRTDGSDVDKADFLAEYARLEREHLAGKPNIGSYRSEGCELCDRCMFCLDCRSCHKCTHCVGCEECSDCSHSRACRSCHACAYCVDCSVCSGGAYLVRCTACVDCTYCFGCVGLVRKDFHILNVQYSRTQYFELLEKLKAELGLA